MTSSPTSREYYIELGKMIVRFNRFEFWLPTILSHILGVHPGISTALIAGERTSTVLKMMKGTALLRATDQNTRDMIRNFIKRALVICDKRGSYVHNTALFNDEQRIAQHYRSRRHRTKAVDFIHQDIDIDDLRKLTDDIDLLFNHMLELFKDFDKLPYKQMLTVYDDKSKPSQMKKAK